MMANSQKIGIAYLKLVYAFGRMNVDDAVQRLQDRFQELDDETLSYHVVMAQEHYCGRLASWDRVTHCLIPAPQTEAQNQLVEHINAHENFWELLNDEQIKLLNTIPFKFAPGWRKMYSQIPKPSLY
tara:strand:+ start:718 stop:1098 length:381 start_codon:yes stop_codon:yes gene_type:complete